MKHAHFVQGLVSIFAFTLFAATPVAADDRVNLAAFKPARQSTTPWGAGPERAVDGNTDGNWTYGSVSHTNLDRPAWWQVDLGRVENIGEIVLYNRTDCCSDRLSNFDIFISDGTDWRYASYHYYYPTQAPARLPFSVQASGRYVTVVLRDQNYLSLAEVQVFAAPPSPPILTWHLDSTESCFDFGSGGCTSQRPAGQCPSVRQGQRCFVEGDYCSLVQGFQWSAFYCF